MRDLNSAPLTSTPQQANIIKRYHEIHFDYSTEFKNTSVSFTIFINEVIYLSRDYALKIYFASILQLAVYRKRESMELFQSSKKSHQDQHDSSVEKLLKERSSVAASLKSINDVIRSSITVLHIV